MYDKFFNGVRREVNLTERLRDYGFKSDDLDGDEFKEFVSDVFDYSFGYAEDLARLMRA